MTTYKRARRRLGGLCRAAAVGALLVAGGCNSASNDPNTTPQAASTTAATAPDALPGPPNTAAANPVRRLVDPADYAASRSRYPSWGFLTPSSQWLCVIATAPSNGDRAVCAANPDQGPLPVRGIPSATNNDGTTSSRTPNVIAIREGADPSVEWLDENIWEEDAAPAVLLYGAVLSAGGMSCNVQEAVVSCREDSTNKGFSLSTNGYRFAYTDVAGG